MTPGASRKCTTLPTSKNNERSTAVCRAQPTSRGLICARCSRASVAPTPNVLTLYSAQASTQRKYAEAYTCQPPPGLDRNQSSKWRGPRTRKQVTLPPACSPRQAPRYWQYICSSAAAIANAGASVLTDIWDLNLTDSGHSRAGSIVNTSSCGLSKAVSDSPPFDKLNSANLARS